MYLNNTVWSENLIFFLTTVLNIVRITGNSYIQGMVIKSMGPVIVTAFNPLRMIIVTGLACIILSEQLYLGRYYYNAFILHIFFFSLY